MEKNFSMTDAVAIQVGSDHYDLHNDFDLALFEVNLIKKSMRLTFTRTREASIPEQMRCVTLIFNEVGYLNVSSGVLGDMVHDIVEIGYKAPGDVDHDWLIKESQASPADHLFLRFVGDEFIRVHCRLAMAKFESFPPISGEHGSVM